MNRVELATKLKCNGASCSQAVACAFAKDLSIDESTLFKLAEGFGGGLGCGHGHCGALSGAIIVAGLINSDGDKEHPGRTKASTMKLSRDITKAFENKVGAIKCSDIKSGSDGKEICSCMDCVKFATQITEEVMGLK